MSIKSFEIYINFFSPKKYSKFKINEFKKNNGHFVLELTYT